MIHSWPITSTEEWLRRRKQNVNASEVAALFGPDVHPYLTPFKLWALKSGKVPDPAENSAMRRGKLFEPVVLELLREDHPDWKLNKTQGYYWDDETRIGCTPDVDGTRPDVYGYGIVQIKTVNFYAWDKRWHDEDHNIAVPTWVAIQASVEAYLTGSTWAGAAAFWTGNDELEVVYVEVPLKPHLIHRIEDLVGDFWRRVAENDPYPPDFGQDRKLVLDLYTQGKASALDLTGDEDFRNLLVRREGLKSLEKTGEKAAKDRKMIDAQIVHRLGNASAAICGGRSVDITIVSKRSYTVKAQQYPLLTVNGSTNE